ncbi:MAG: response regulator, partial [Rhizobiaceae bacterium]
VPANVIGDPARLRQVLLNLLGNSIKFTQAGQVSLRITRAPCASDNTMLLFTVEDTGIGIAADKLGQVFERFTQADSSTTRRFGGSGLGLTISKQLVELMGGSMTVDSKLDHGSIFSFTLPFDTSSLPFPLAVAPMGDEPIHDLLPLRILMAEDSPDNCTITIAYLADTPYTLHIAGTGAKACEMYRQGGYDLVLMDRQMPVMDGLSAVREIRGWEQTNGLPTTPIIALTASALKGDREACLAAGCTAFLTKPIKQDVLLRAIREHTHGLPEQLPVAVGRAQTRLIARIPAYLQNCKENLIRIRAAHEALDYPTISLLGHNLRGSGGAFGFPLITEMGCALELAADRSQDREVEGLIKQLSVHLDGILLPLAPASN